MDASRGGTAYSEGRKLGFSCEHPLSSAILAPTQGGKQVAPPFADGGTEGWKAAQPKGLSSWKGNSVTRQPKPGSSWQGSGGGRESLALPRPQARGPDSSPRCWPASEGPRKASSLPEHGDSVIGSPSFQQLPSQPLSPGGSQSPLLAAPGDGGEVPERWVENTRTVASNTRSSQRLTSSPSCAPAREEGNVLADQSTSLENTRT